MSKSKKGPNMLALADAMVEDILRMTEEELLAEASEDGVDAKAELAREREFIATAKTLAAKSRLKAAQAAVRDDRDNPTVVSMTDRTVDRYSKILKSGSSAALPITLAARNGSDMSESDRQKLIEDMIELGIELPKED
ncbi:hypothetical protein G6L37_17735 [Agrobacterium rubi]|uniref:hypothetical protein n=1 Tax=Agrobacterium rubi TaxID=28099 RepID=UPI001572FF9F|nr:hypothetical protein [Agrobacterium rubi]NTF08011.1 hypothetical protein [Agrobacterium rubi]NTF20239.1 hypothetical protein [Agrobacterium rubi]NTF27210.1 hypothetical protein [Agrobacterium rubi]